MEIGKEYLVNNPLGYMKIKILKEIKQTKNINIQNEDGNLGKFNKLRLEFYEGGFITVYSSELENKIYLIQTPFEYNYNIKVYECEIIHTEMPRYDFERIDIYE